MPLPTPNKGESEQDFVSRCMSNETMQREYSKQDQRLAVCYSQFRSRKVQDQIKTPFDAVEESAQKLIARIQGDIDQQARVEASPIDQTLSQKVRKKLEELIKH